MIFPIDKETVEDQLEGQVRWVQKGQHRQDRRYFALCPYCENPIQLKALFKRSADSPAPYGSHTGHSVSGFEFNLSSMQAYPYTRPQTNPKKTDKRQLDDLASQLINLAVSQFDRIVLILRQEYRFAFSNEMAGRMLRDWLTSEGYLYYGAHLRNLPWMIGYFASNENMFGQNISQFPELQEAIAKTLPQAQVSDQGRLIKGTAYYHLSMFSLHHRSVFGEDKSLIETLKVRFKDYSNTNDPAQAPTVFLHTITFRPERFEALMNTPPARAKRDEKLLALARDIAAEVL